MNVLFDGAEKSFKKCCNHRSNLMKATMRVAMYYNNSDVRLQEVPVPAIGAGELLVKVMASGICGSDIMEWYRAKRAPPVLGHDMSGNWQRPNTFI